MTHKHLLVAFCLAAAHYSAVGAAERLPFIGVWRVVDASEPAAKGEGGVVFRADGTGEFYSASFSMKLPDDLAKLSLVPTSGRSDITFTYTVRAGQLITQMVAMDETAIKADPIGWVVNISDANMTMARVDGVVTFSLERVVIPK